jgi:hypothetical protein
MNLRLALVVVVAVSACKSKPTLDGPCDPKQMEMLRSASKNVNSEDRATITTAGLAEACELKLPSGVAEGMKALGSVSPADRATIIAGVLSENMSFTRLACPEFETIAKGIASLEPAKKSEFLYSGCKYERFDLLTKAEFEQSWKVSGYVLLAVPMYAWLIDKNMEPAEAKRLARDMFLGEVAEPSPEAPPADAPPAPVPAQ